MKVLLVVGTLHAGGLERFVTRVSKQAIESHEFTPLVLCLHKREGIFLSELESLNVQVIEASKGWSRNILRFIELIRSIKHLNPDIVHSQVNFSIIQQWLVYYFAGIRRIAFTERNCYPIHGVNRLKRFFQFYFVKLFGASYSANSEDVKVHLAKMVAYAPEKIKVLPNGVGIALSSEEARDQIRGKYYWENDEIVFGYVARMNRHKGHLYFIEVMLELENILDRKIKICFVGGGETLPEIERKVHDSGLKELTTFTGVVGNVQELMNGFDIVCLFSEREGMPNVVIEAMSCGKVVVANPVGNVRELFDGGAGMINPEASPHKTAMLIKQLIEDPGKVYQMEQLAKERIEKSFSLNASFQTLVEYYHSL